MKYHVILEKKREKKRREDNRKKSILYWMWRHKEGENGTSISWLYIVWQIVNESVRVCMKIIVLGFAFLGMLGMLYAEPRREIHFILQEMIREIVMNFGI